MQRVAGRVATKPNQDRKNRPRFRSVFGSVSKSLIVVWSVSHSRSLIVFFPTGSEFDRFFFRPGRGSVGFVFWTIGFGSGSVVLGSVSKTRFGRFFRLGLV